MSANLPQTTIDLRPEDRALLLNDLSRLTPDKKSELYFAVCNSVGLNPLTQPLTIMKDKVGKEFFYANRNCTDQLRSLKNVSIHIVAREKIDDLYVVTARATLPSGRSDESIGAGPLTGLKGEALSNAIMKIETKAKRRVTLCICGLSFMDELEAETIEGTKIIPVDISAVQNLSTNIGHHTVANYPSLAPNMDFLPPSIDPLRGSDNLDDYLGVDMKAVTDKIDLYTIPFGKYTGRGLRDLGLHACENYAAWIKSKANEDGKEIRGQVLEFIETVELFSKEYQQTEDKQYWRDNGHTADSRENQDQSHN